MSYLYNDGDLYNFMNTETYDQVALTKEQVGDSLKFVKENEVVKVCSWNGNVYADVYKRQLFASFRISFFDLLK